MDDSISRQAAKVSVTRYFEVHIRNQKSRRLKEHAKKICEDICFGIDAWPSAQPEIIRCRDCKWKNQHNCTRAVEVWIDDDKYCAWGERRTDETD